MSSETDNAGGVVLDVAGLDVRYGPATALSEVSFRVAAGETVAVLGPNGGGKTTLFRALLGLTVQTASERLDIHRTVAYVPQSERPRLDFPVNVTDVVLMGTYRNLPWYRPVGHARRQRAAEALEKVGLADHARKPFASLSGGQRQRVLIARALAGQAGIYLLDEPYTGVDAPSATRIDGIVDELRNQGAALLVSSHDIEHARRFDKVLCLNHHQVAFGEPDKVLVPEVLAATYGAELIEVEGGPAILMHHHDHDH